jgi:sugar phosphate permease
VTHLRWTVVTLLFFAVTINDVDRAVIGVLKPVLDSALGWDQRDYGWMVTAFQAAYALGYVASGPLLDRFGVRLGFPVAVALVALAAAAHCGYAANLFTLVSDTVPRQAVGSVVGIGGMAGSIAGMAFAQIVARVLHATNNNYVVPFATAATTYSLALLLIHLLLPKLEPMAAAGPHRVLDTRR